MPVENPLSWMCAMLIAWFCGEWWLRWGSPRVLTYSIIGLVLGPGLHWIDPVAIPQGRYITDFAMGLALFEIGFRLNPSWLARNRWVIVTSIGESIATYVAVFGCGIVANLSLLQSSILASLCVATSPISVLRVTRDAQSSGQVTNLILTMSALNSLAAILLFKGSVGIGLHSTSDNNIPLRGAVLFIVLSSIGLAILAAMVFAIVRKWIVMPQDSVAFTIALYVGCVTFAADWARLSPALATIVLGIAFRSLDIKITGKYQDFGSLGRFGTIFLYLYVSAGISFLAAWQGLYLGLFVVLVRAAAKIGMCTFMAKPLGATTRKGFLAGLGLMPVSVFGLIVLEQANQLGMPRFGIFPQFASIALCLEILGPLATSLAIRWSGEHLD
jgi:Kef-type K+ transport system membrane component KefB